MAIEGAALSIRDVANLVLYSAREASQGHAEARRNILLAVGADAELYDEAVVGIGRLLFVNFFMSADAVAAAYRPRIRIDGRQVLPFDVELTYWKQYLTTSNQVGFFIQYDAANHLYSLSSTIPFSFTKKLEVGYYSSAGLLSGFVNYCYELIT
jgi:hypothetical protein